MKKELSDQVVSALRSCPRMLFITGACLSADSGLPTYRGIGGLYNRNQTEERIPIEEALPGDMMRRHPEIACKYIYRIEAACRRAVKE